MTLSDRGAAGLDRLCIDTIRTLAIDAIEQARSGHPGMPLAMAPVAYTLWQRHLRYDPRNPLWPDRDRFVLSAGHASMLLYPLLHLAGVRRTEMPGFTPPVRPAPPAGCEDDPGEDPTLAITLDDIRRFRQWGSLCAGHPEYGLATGIECTTGPLGQGAGMSVGMAVAARWLAARYNRPRHELFGHRVFALCSDGDIMEGISAEAASLAGHLRLSNLCWIYDRNRITIEGSTDLALSEEVGARFEAYGWRVRHVADANDVESVDRAFSEFAAASAESPAPTLILIDSRIAWGAPKKEGTSAAHGEPLGTDEARGTKRNYGWPEEARFLVPDGVRGHFQAGLGRRGASLQHEWRERFEAYGRAFPAEAAELDLIFRRALPEGWDSGLPSFPADPKGPATRTASGRVLNAVAPRIPWLLGGSADLGPSIKTVLAGESNLSAAEPGGRNLRFGIREHAMGALVNGLCLSGLRGYGSSFLVFSDYLRPALRQAALMRQPAIFFFSHDSIGLGEDGPTHQPVEHLAALRAIPGLIVLRPADAAETVEAWKVIVELRHEPAVLVLTRQDTPCFAREEGAAASSRTPGAGDPSETPPRCAPAEGLRRGGYVLLDPLSQAPRVILIGTGSEVALCLEAHSRLCAEGVPSRVVSLPSRELFERQDAAYRDTVLPPAITARVTVEAASTFGWERYAGAAGAMIGLHRFGASAPGPVLYRAFGLTVEAVVEAARAQAGAPGATPAA